MLLPLGFLLSLTPKRTNSQTQKMACRQWWFLGWTLFFAPGLVSAQIKVRQPVEVWPELQANYELDNNNFFFFRNEYRHSTGPGLNTLGERSPWNQFSRIQAQLGYEHAFSQKWSGGTSGRYAFEGSHDILFTELFLRHTGSILEQLRFMKRASFEHLLNVGQPNSGRFRLLGELDKVVELAGERVVRPRVSYEIFKNSSFGESLGQDGRTINRTRLRFDLSFELNRYLFFSPYFTRQTDYYVLEPQFDSAGMQTRPGGKHNFITPILGLGIRYNFYESATAVSSRHR